MAGRARPFARVAAILAIAVVLAGCATSRSDRAGNSSGSSGAGAAAPTRATASAAASLAPQIIATATDAAGKPMAIVWMGDHYYSPSTLTVSLGTTVMWWMLGQQEHDVWAYDGSFHSPTLGPGSKFTHTFTTLGTFKYLCLPHSGDGMYGQVIVVEP